MLYRGYSSSSDAPSIVKAPRTICFLDFRQCTSPKGHSVRGTMAPFWLWLWPELPLASCCQVQPHTVSVELTWLPAACCASDELQSCLSEH